MRQDWNNTLLGISLHILLYAAGQPASRTQFPLQYIKRKALPNITLILNSHMFSAGQAYVSINRCPMWDNLHSIDAFITDPSVIEEYNRLQMLAKQCLPHTRDIHANISVICSNELNKFYILNIF